MFSRIHWLSAGQLSIFIKNLERNELMNMKRKSLLSLIVTVIMVFSFAMTAIAAEDSNVGKYTSVYYEYFSKVTGKTEYELRVIEKEYGDLGRYFNLRIPTDIISAQSILESSKNVTKEKKNQTFKKDPSKIPGYFESFAAFSGLTVDQLKEIYKKYGELSQHFGVEFDVNRLEALNAGGYASIASSGGGSDTPMTDEQFAYMKSKADKGDIVVTKDQWFGPVNHGHAAIVVQSDTPTKYIVDHTGSGLSSKRNFDNYKVLYTMRLYYTNGVTGDVRRAAADYAVSNLQGWKYDALADIDSTTYVNCATLVWKALKSQGITHKTRIIPINEYYYITTVWPADFVTDSKTTFWAGVNWPGDNKKW